MDSREALAYWPAGTCSGVPMPTRVMRFSLRSWALVILAGLPSGTARTRAFWAKFFRVAGSMMAFFSASFIHLGLADR